MQRRRCAHAPWQPKPASQPYAPRLALQDRPPLQNYWLDKPGAKDATVAHYRDKVRRPAGGWLGARMQRRRALSHAPEHLHAAAAGASTRRMRLLRTRAHAQVKQYLSSDAFKQRVSALKAQQGNERGIVISTGGPLYLPQARRAAPC